jgi:hypothetical protein
MSVLQLRLQTKQIGRILPSSARRETKVLRRLPSIALATTFIGMLCGQPAPFVVTNRYKNPGCTPITSMLYELKQCICR